MTSRSKFGDAWSKFETRPDLGRIHYKLRYDDNVLHVTVVECNNLKRIDPFRKSDTLVRLYLLPGVHDVIKTKVIKKNQNPVFRQKFKIPVSLDSPFLLLTS